MLLYFMCFCFFRTMVILEKQDNEVFGFEVQVSFN